MPFSRTTATAAMAAAQLPKGNNHVVDLLTRVPVNRGSLVKSIDNLLKTIEMSENAVMIPTLLRDKVRVDAWELLFVAKILKASILGHGDLVEFYMNHLNSDQQEQDQQQQQQQNLNQQQQNLNQQQAAAAGSPQLQHHGTIYEASSSAASSVSSGSSSSSSTSSSPSFATSKLSNGGATSTTSSGASWTTGQQQAPDASKTGGGCSSASSCSSTASNGHCNSAAAQNGASDLAKTTTEANQLLKADFIGELAQQTADEALLAARPLLVQQQQQQQQRQAQPPSLLQLTTTNNHINSLLQYPAEQQQQQQQPTSNGLPAPQQDQQQQQQQLTISTAPTSNGGARAAELRTSRSAGCLFRTNSSGASSPRTPVSTGGLLPGGIGGGHTAPNTPLGGQPADSLPGELPGDPSALVKLLMQIEQLKSSIAHVSGQLESVVELYKRSIDNIST